MKCKELQPSYTQSPQFQGLKFNFENKYSNKWNVYLLYLVENPLQAMTALSLDLVDISRDWVSFFVMLSQAFTADDCVIDYWLFGGLSVFSLVFSEWNAAQSGWDQETDSTSAEYSTFYPQKLLGCFCSVLGHCWFVLWSAAQSTLQHLTESGQTVYPWLNSSGCFYALKNKAASQRCHRRTISGSTKNHSVTDSLKNRLFLTFLSSEEPSFTTNRQVLQMFKVL